MRARGRLVALTGLTPAGMRERLEDRRLPRRGAALPRRRTSRTCSPARATRRVAGAAGRGAGGVGGMSRPLLISDCDDVLLHFAPHFADWVAEAHGLDFPARRAGLRAARSGDANGAPVDPRAGLAAARPVLRRRDAPPAPRRRRASRRCARSATRPTSSSSPISATNIAPTGSRNWKRFDIRHRVLCNQGGKGRPVLELIERDAAERAPSSSTISPSTTNRWPSTRRRCGGCR